VPDTGLASGTCPGSEVPLASRRPPGWGKAGAGLGVVAAESAAGYLHPGLAGVLAIADLAIPLAVLLILLAIVVRGSDQTCERVFRLLRWITNRPEPPATAS
jgi:hypothetical protein